MNADNRSPILGLRGSCAVATNVDDDDRDDSWDGANCSGNWRCWQTRSPMAMAVIGVLMTSWLLTLVVIPLVFTYMDGLQIWIFNLMRGKKRGEGRSIQL
jgi:hypothetical protein